jgi:hypothetical protein
MHDHDGQHCLAETQLIRQSWSLRCCDPSVPEHGTTAIVRQTLLAEYQLAPSICRWGVHCSSWQPHLTLSAAHCGRLPVDAPSCKVEAAGPQAHNIRGQHRPLASNSAHQCFVVHIPDDCDSYMSCLAATWAGKLKLLLQANPWRLQGPRYPAVQHLTSSYSTGATRSYNYHCISIWSPTRACSTLGRCCWEGCRTQATQPPGSHTAPHYGQQPLNHRMGNVKSEPQQAGQPAPPPYGP